MGRAFWRSVVVFALLSGLTSGVARSGGWRLLYDSALPLSFPVAAPQELRLLEQAARLASMPDRNWRLLSRVPGPFLKTGT